MIQFITILSALGAFALALYTLKKPTCVLFVIPTLFISFEVFARAGGGSSGKCGFLCMILAPFFIFYSVYITYKINKKNKAVKEALVKIALREPQWSEDKLIVLATKIFRDLQNAWGEHDMGTIKNHLHPSLYTDWESQISAQKSRGERNVMQGLSVNNVRIINVKNFSDDEHDEFTVCFDAEANDQTLVGNKVQKEKKEGFREFWTFEWEKGKWTVREITQSSGWKRYIYAPIVDEVNRGLVARKKA